MSTLARYRNNPILYRKPQACTAQMPHRRYAPYSLHEQLIITRSGKVVTGCVTHINQTGSSGRVAGERVIKTGVVWHYE